MTRISLADGFPLEDPSVCIPWNVSVQELEQLLGSQLATERSSRYLRCRSLGGIDAQIQFYFHDEPADVGTPIRPTFSVTYFPIISEESAVRDKLLAAFGAPATTDPKGDAGPEFPDLLWDVDGIPVSMFSMFLRDNQTHLMIHLGRPQNS